MQLQELFEAIGFMFAFAVLAPAAFRGWFSPVIFILRPLVANAKNTNTAPKNNTGRNLKIGITPANSTAAFTLNG